MYLSEIIQQIINEKFIKDVINPRQYTSFIVEGDPDNTTSNSEFFNTLPVKNAVLRLKDRLEGLGVIVEKIKLIDKGRFGYSDSWSVDNVSNSHDNTWDSDSRGYYATFSFLVNKDNNRQKVNYLILFMKSRIDGNKYANDLKKIYNAKPL